MCFWAKVVLHFVKLVLSMLQNLLRLWRVVFASFQFSLFCLTIFLVDGLKIKMVAGRCRATAGRRHVDRKCAVVAQVKGGHTNASLNSLLASSPFWNSPFWFGVQGFEWSRMSSKLHALPSNDFAPCNYFVSLDCRVDLLSCNIGFLFNLSPR